MSETLTIYGNCESGNCLKVRWAADRLGVPYEWVEVDIFSGAARTEEFLKLNPAGQVPCAAFPDGRTLSQSNAIVLYFADKSDLLPSDPFDHAKVMQWLFWEQYSHEPYIAVRRFQKKFAGKSEAEIDPKLMAQGRRALGVMEMELGRKEYFVADRLTAADIALVAYTRVAHEGGFDLSEFPNVRTWIARVERDLELEPIVVEAA